MLIRRSVILLIIFICAAITRGENSKVDPKDEKKSSVEELRRKLSINKPAEAIPRTISNAALSEISNLKGELLKAPSINFEFSATLTKMLKDAELNSEPVVGIAVDNETNSNYNEKEELIDNPNVKESFQPNYDEIKILTNLRHSESNIHNLHRENLVIKTIREKSTFKIGANVEQWKTFSLDKDVVLIGKTKNSILLVIKSNETFEIANEIQIQNASLEKACIEVLKLWDHTKNEIRNLLAIALNGEIIWYELSERKLVEIYRWRIMKNIDKISYFQHDGSDVLMITAIDDQNRFEVGFIEFNFSTEEFWVVQSFKLPNLPSSIACLDAGKDLIVAFTQQSHIKIYRHQNTKFERGKFTFLKSIDAANVSVISGFRIGGYSYLAIGGDQPQILRYVNGEFHTQTILSQTFGHVEEFLPVPIKIYRDDLILLVQHRIMFRSHSVIAVDALIWNGIAFESALSIPCKVIAKPDATGFTCMLDIEREEGLLGASFILDEGNNTFYIVIPRHEAHSGLFHIDYEIVETEDPLVKEMEQIKKAIISINEMLDTESKVKQQIDEVFKNFVYPKNDFEFENLLIDSIKTDVVHFDGNVLLESDRIDFLDASFSREDFIANLDDIEKTLLEDEKKLKEIDAELNKLIRKNRQSQINVQSSKYPPDSPIYYLGPYRINGQLNSKTIKVLPQDTQIHESRRKKREIDPIEENIVNNLRVNNIIAETINGIPVSDFLFLENDGELNVPNKDIVFDDNIIVDEITMLNNGRVNGIDLSHEVLAIDSEHFPEKLIFENAKIDYLTVEKLNDIQVDSTSLQNISLNLDNSLTSLSAKKANVHHNLVVETINGVNWDEFTSKLISKNSKSFVQNLTVIGNVWMVDNESELNIDTLNHLAFPYEYVLKVGPQSTVISGRKIFSKTLATTAIDTDGVINGISPLDMITLDQEQVIPTETTFNLLEVNKMLEVHGTISGRELDKFLPNPTLESTNEIPAACSFRELIVEGVVKVENSFNQNNLESVLSDVVYENSDSSDEEVIISSQKTFNNLEVSGDASIISNFINNVKLDNIMTVDEEQIVTFDKMHGSIFFSNLNIDGLFDGINVTDLEMNSIRTFGDQYIQTPIRISKHVDAKSIEVKHSLNNVSIKDFYSISQPIVLPENMKVAFFELNVNNLNLKSDLIGTAKLRNLNLEEFSRYHLSKSIEQTIQVPVKINNLITRNVFNGNQVNGMDFRKFKEYMKGLKNFKDVLLSGNFKLDSLIIDGDVKLQAINDRNFNELVENVIWLNRPNEIENKLKFLDGIDVRGRLMLEGKINNKNFNNFISNWISSTEDPVRLNGDKIFKNEVQVGTNLEIFELNGIIFKNILKKEDVLELKELTVYGSVKAKKVNVNEYFNHDSVESLNLIYPFDKESNTHTINANVKFNKNVEIDSLETPFINEKKTVDLLEDFVKTNDYEIHISTEIVFKGNIMAEQGVYIKMFNDVNMTNLLRNIVILNGNEIININSNIVFENDVFVPLVGLRGNLSTDSISGCNIAEWISHTIPIDRDYEYNGSLKSDSRLIKTPNLKIRKLNGIPFDHIFTLHTEQAFDHAIVVKDSVKIREPLIVTGTVNKRNIKAERENTIMVNEKNQTIYTNILLPGAVVLKSVKTNGLINSKRIEKIATLDSSLEFDSSQTFSSLEATSVVSDNKISLIDFNDWYKNAVWKNGKETQVISGAWKINEAFLNDNVFGNGYINRKPINEIERNLKINVNAIEMALGNYTNQYSDMCEKLQDRAENYAQNSIYVLKYFEFDFRIIESSEIFSYFSLKTKGEDFLLVNTKCTTHIYKWNSVYENFTKIDSVETGVVYDWVKLETKSSKNGKKDIFVVTNSRIKAGGECTNGGLNSWKLVDDRLINIAKISTEDDTLELYVNPVDTRTFYALNITEFVLNYDVYGRIIEEWKLPSESLSYSFIPSGILPGLNLHNNRRIFSLNSKFPRREKRHFFTDVNLKNYNSNPMFTFKMPELSFKDRKHSIPTIPAKSVGSTQRLDFMSKIKKTGEIIRRTLNFETEKIKSLKPNTNETNTDMKLSKLNKNETNKLLFVINSPDISTIKKNLNNFTTIQNKSLNDAIAKTLNQIEDDEVTKMPVVSTLETEKKISSAQSLSNFTTTTTESSIILEPRIIMPEDDNENDLILGTDRQIEIAPIQGNGLRNMENNYIPDKEFGEVTVLYVGVSGNKRPLYAVKRKRDSVIKGNDFIEIYSNIIEGKVFQYIQCTNPSHIVALQFRDETLLAFLENQKEVQIFIYKGIEGFTFFKKITLPTEVSHMSTVVLPPKIEYKCDHHYLVLHNYFELLFLGVKIDGNCGIHAVQCNEKY